MVGGRPADTSKARVWIDALPGVDAEMAKRRRIEKHSSQHAAGINNILEVAVDVGRRLASLKIPYCFIGGIACQRWGEPRQTVDVDATIFVGFGNESTVVDELLSLYQARMEGARDFAIQHRILLLTSDRGTGIDLSLGGMPFERRLVDRSVAWHIQRHGSIRICSAEDLVVLKAFASRPQDWIDVEKVIVRQGSRLDRKLILEELTPLAELKEEPDILDRLHELFHNNDT